MIYRFPFLYPILALPSDHFLLLIYDFHHFRHLFFLILINKTASATTFSLTTSTSATNISFILTTTSATTFSLNTSASATTFSFDLTTTSASATTFSFILTTTSASTTTFSSTTITII